MELMEAILEHFPNTAWAKAKSKKQDEALKKLAEFTTEEIIAKLPLIRSTHTRAHITPEEIVKRMKEKSKTESFAAKRAQKELEERIHNEQVMADRPAMLAELKAMSVDAVRNAVRYLRSKGVIDATPLAPEIATWSWFTIGMVWAAAEKGKR